MIYMIIWQQLPCANLKLGTLERNSIKKNFKEKQI